MNPKPEPEPEPARTGALTLTLSHMPLLSVSKAAKASCGERPRRWMRPRR